MNPKLIFLLAGLLPLLSVLPLRAQSITLNIEAETLQTSAGAPMPTSGLVLVVADTGNDGFSALDAGAQLSVGSVIGGTDDKIIGAYNLT